MNESLRVPLMMPGEFLEPFRFNLRAWAIVNVCELGQPDSVIELRALAVEQFLRGYEAKDVSIVVAIMKAQFHGRRMPLDALISRTQRLAQIAGIDPLPPPADSAETPDLLTAATPRKKARA